MAGAIDPRDLPGLISGGQLDATVIERLRQADPAAMRAMLSSFLPDDQVDRILARVRELVDAASREPGTPRPEKG